MSRWTLHRPTGKLTETLSAFEDMTTGKKNLSDNSAQVSDHVSRRALIAGGTGLVGENLFDDFSGRAAIRSGHQPCPPRNKNCGKSRKPDRLIRES